MTPAAGRAAAFRRAGVALISVMMVVAMVATTASWLMFRNHLTVRRALNTVHYDQAMLLVFGVEDHVMALLTEDAEDDGSRKVDYYRKRFDDPEQEAWNRPGTMGAALLGFEGVSDAALNWCVHDMQSYYNINNMYQIARKRPARLRDYIADPTKMKEDPKKRDDWWEFKRFENAVRLSYDEGSGSIHLLPLLFDWFDEGDAVTRILPAVGAPTPRVGAESPEYLALEPPYRPSRMMMSWPDELLLLKGVNGLGSAPASITALPMPDTAPPVKLNVETLAENDALLRDLLYLMEVEPIFPEAWVQLQETMRIQPFGSVKTFLDRMYRLRDRQFDTKENPGLERKELNQYAKYLTTHSDYFLLATHSKIGQAEVRMQSVLYREPKSPYRVSVLQRRSGAPPFERRGCRGAPRPIDSKDDDDEDEENEEEA